MALCGTHHWIFDKGLITVSSTYHILVSPCVPTEDEHTQSLLTLHEQQLSLPQEQELHPAKLALNWHRKNVYRG